MAPNSLYRWVESRATRPALVLGTLVWIASALGVLALQSRVLAHSGGLPVPDISPLYAPEELYTLLEGYGARGRRAFLEFTLYDVLYPFVAYGVAALALAALTRSLVASSPRWTWVVWVPAAGLFVELLEQAGFLVTLALFPTRVDTLAWSLSALTLAKFLVLVLLLCLLAGLAFWQLLARARCPAKRGR